MLQQFSNVLRSRRITSFRILIVLLMVVLAMPPCGHAEINSTNWHQKRSELDLCYAAPGACQCHGCEKQSCQTKEEADLTLRSSARVTNETEPNAVKLEYGAPRHKFVQPVLKVSDILIALRTVQLLI
jgi:hypothetical protein